MKQKILYVEDEPFLAKIVTETLEQQGFEVLLITNGGKVIPAFEQFVPDICVLDVMLPGMDGFALGKIIHKRYPSLPIVFLTAKSFTEDVLAGFESGANDYIRKPFSMEELIVRIRTQLRIGTSKTIAVATTEHTKIGAFTFFPDRLELQGTGGSVKLSYRETQVLSLLAENQNQTTDRKALLLAVWGDDSFFNSRTLDVYIRKLRTYLAQDSSLEIITLKGKGYLFRVNTE